MADDTVPLASLGPTAKTGQTIMPVDLFGQLERARQAAVNLGGEATGVNDLARVLSGEMPWTEAAAAMLPMALGGPEAKAAEEAVPLARGALHFWEHQTPQAPALLGNPLLRGSMNPLDEMPFIYKGKNPNELTPQEFKEVGDIFGVPNLGPESPAVPFNYADTGTFNIPGGLEGKFTYYDLLRMKAEGIDPSRIDRALHTQLQQKLMRTMTPEEPSAAHIWSGLTFGMTSPNNPLFPNQLAQSRLRLRDPEFLDQLANSIPWQAGDKVPAADRLAASNKVAGMLGLDAADKGGLGVRGSMDYSRIAELAQMYQKNPEFFRKTPDESWQQFVERLSSQVPGLSMKTGSFGSVWQNPGGAGISAIDRHMVNEFDKTGGLFRDAEDQADFEKRVVERWNRNNPDRQVGDFNELKKQNGSESLLNKAKLEYVGSALEPKFRLASGEINPKLPEHLQNADWVVEPQKVTKMGDAYARALDWNQQLAEQHGLSLFPSQ